ncbi:hypothetical protein [Streptomyces alboflavus]|uniref:hypothetical protein n=1 Tax=Streptomyces alboflavus TaxID=67267 RepID=UPI0004C1C661|nr:hypothetical protein [Streptomyces alboflavus]
MKARAAAAGRRLCRGTWLGITAWGRWQTATDARAAGRGPAALAHAAGVLLRRLVLAVLAATFYGLLLLRAPHLIYAVPVVWLYGAWHMSDSSATPPPRGVAPLGDVIADETGDVERVDLIAEGVGCIIHPVRVEGTPTQPTD